MRSTIVSSALLLAVTAGALKVTEPKKNVEIDPSSSFTVKWDSVNTDPTSFDLYLVNNAVYPPVDKKIATDVDTSDGSYTIDSISGLADGPGYQINLFSNEEHNTGILAQSQQFNVTGSDDSSSSSSSSATPTSTSTSTSSTSTGTSTTTTSTETDSESSSSTASTSLTTGASTTTSASSSESSSAAASTTSGAADANASDVFDGENGAGAMSAPLVVAAGVIGGALLFNL
ncbi:Ser-Thr-rich glycosyl-phosphatidyl-inositol-anchored membrane family-domain-containing protein [Aspergillus keveii]|uniref:Ser-Thr-rich glycosyl-phosphatidyl-inositol-anchored membrane family-domain-containing protein n=1 Tax=Aspergillus keveii TaxID=714993 RepID=A0ABR4FXR1_9EURO